jgi:hypothetical protein
MMKKKLVLWITAAVLLLVAAGIVLWHHHNAASSDNSRKHEVSNADLRKAEKQIDIHIKRYEEALFSLDTAHLAEGLKQLATEYPEILIDKNAWKDPRMLYQLKAYISDPIIREIYEDVMRAFPDLKDIEAELNAAMSYYLTYFPEDSLPVFYTLVPGLNIDMPTVYGYGNDIFIHLDMYLGSDYKYYSQIGMPMFVIQRCDRKYLAVECVSKAIVYRYLSQKQPLTLLDNIIYEGKKMYFTEMMFPDKPEADVIEYSPEKYEWAVKNQGKVWSYIIEKDLLFSKQNKDIRQFVDDTPFTKPFNNTSPGRMGVFIGWKIIQKYMENNPDVTLQALMEDSDSQQILNKSGYKPQNKN